MALISTINCKYYHEPFHFHFHFNFNFNHPDSKPNPSQLSGRFQKYHSSVTWKERRRFEVVSCSGEDSGQIEAQGEISPLLPNSCRYVLTCSEYSMIAYKNYGVAEGTLLTAWRLCRCNPLGGSGFDPPRWFDETTPPEQ